MIYIILFISLFLEGIVSNFTSFQNSLFLPLFCLITIVLLYPYGKDNIKKYALCGLGYGIIYDFIYTQALFLDGILFVLIIFIIHFLYQWASRSMIGKIFLLLLSICIYRISGYLILCMIGYAHFNMLSLLIAIRSSLLLNILYGFILFSILSKYYKKRTSVF